MGDIFYYCSLVFITINRVVSESALRMETASFLFAFLRIKRYSGQPDPHFRG